jgi:DNA-binding GntR family transcriptional regulator
VFVLTQLTGHPGAVTEGKGGSGECCACSSSPSRIDAAGRLDAAGRPVSTPSSAGRVAARKPPYEVIATHFRDRIQRGVLKPGDRIPSTAQIAQTWRVATRTADRAIQRLLEEGLLTADGPGGPVVATANRREAVTVVLDGLAPALVDSMELTEIDPAVAERLGVRAGSSVLILHFTVAT